MSGREGKRLAWLKWFVLLNCTARRELKECRDVVRLLGMGQERQGSTGMELGKRDRKRRKAYLSISEMEIPGVCTAICEQYRRAGNSVQEICWGAQQLFLPQFLLEIARYVALRSCFHKWELKDKCSSHCKLRTGLWLAEETEHLLVYGTWWDSSQTPFHTQCYLYSHGSLVNSMVTGKKSFLIGVNRNFWPANPTSVPRKITKWSSRKIFWVTVRTTRWNETIRMASLRTSPAWPTYWPSVLVQLHHWAREKLLISRLWNSVRFLTWSPSTCFSKFEGQGFDEWTVPWMMNWLLDCTQRVVSNLHMDFSGQWCPSGDCTGLKAV